VSIFTATSAMKSLSYRESSFNSFLDAIESSSAAVSLSKSAGSGKTSTAGFSIAYTEEKTICIPPNTSKYIKEYKINEQVYRECNFYRFPKAKNIKTMSFSKENSPLVFGNKLAYSFNNEDIINVETIFYVSEITNYPRESVIIYTNDYCGKKLKYSQPTFKDPSPDKFYIKYEKKDGDSLEY